MEGSLPVEVRFIYLDGTLVAIGTRTSAPNHGHQRRRGHAKRENGRQAGQRCWHGHARGGSEDNGLSVCPFALHKPLFATTNFDSMRAKGGRVENHCTLVAHENRSCWERAEMQMGMLKAKDGAQRRESKRRKGRKR